MDIVITPGEPAGIGPDLVLQLASQENCGDWVVVADPALLEQRARDLGLKVALRPASDRTGKGQLRVLPAFLAAPVTPGRPDPANARYVLDTLDQAISGCRQGRFGAMVTGPVQKSVINDAGISFSGHTEYLQQKCQVDQVVMMLATPGLRVVLATTHLPLRAVADAITPALLERVLTITHHSLIQQFGIPRPRLLVCGLNPHAGEGGHLGREELAVINPTRERLRQTGMELTGPLPADTLFTPHHLARGDAVLAMYHDQGLPVLKHMGFGQAVNITLGLPIIRTSVDHGTALDLAARGGADSGSLRAALTQARDMVAAAAGGSP